MTFLRSVELKSSAPDSGAGHPFDVPAIAAMAECELVVRLDSAVTVFVGDNGSGKSTLLEAMAVSQGMNAEGGARGMQFQTRDGTVSTLHEHLRVLRSPRPPRDMFFLRAESYFNVATAIENYGPRSLALYGGSPHAKSHGESFIDLIVHRFGPDSVFVLDEPRLRCRFTDSYNFWCACTTSSPRGHEYDGRHDENSEYPPVRDGVKGTVLKSDFPRGQRTGDRDEQERPSCDDPGLRWLAMAVHAPNPGAW